MGPSALPKIVGFIKSNIDITNQIIIYTDDAIGYRSRCEGKSISLYRNGELLADGIMSTGEIEGFFPSLCMANLTYHDDTFESFSEEDTYTLAIGDEEPIGMAFLPTSGKLFTQELYDGLRPYAEGVNNTWYAYGDAQTFSIAQKAQTTRKKYDVKLLPEELLPKSVAKKSEVKSVEKVANSASDRADMAYDNAFAAQNAAIEAQNAAIAAQNTANSLVTDATAVYTLGGETTNLISTTINGITFYKIGDLPNSFISVTSGTINFKKGGSRGGSLDKGVGCLTSYGWVIVVTTPGNCQVPLNPQSQTMYQFMAPDSGIYSRKNSSTGDEIKGFDLYYKTLSKTVQNGDTSVLFHSSTPNSTKQFKITVDDTGAISATEVTT